MPEFKISTGRQALIDELVAQLPNFRKLMHMSQSELAEKIGKQFLISNVKLHLWVGIPILQLLRFSSATVYFQGKLISIMPKSLITSCYLVTKKV